ncbi:hypothetical protein FQR65_LT14581 [Abscondita terminalis]|nr:hypothetical protein FQR65_LT14581 [Abscondita terminalis]
MNKLETKCKNKWSDEETKVFLSLCQKENILKMMDGKKLRIKQIFASLEESMRQHGYERDGDQMLTKWKNLKAMYYKCKRHNTTSGNDPQTFMFNDMVNTVLEDRPLSRLTSSETSTEMVPKPVINELDLTDDSIIVEFLNDYDNLPDYDGARAGSSGTSMNSNSEHNDTDDAGCGCDDTGTNKISKKKTNPNITLEKQTFQKRKKNENRTCLRHNENFVC